MSGDTQIELWLHEYKMEALSSVLEQQGTTVEERMQEMLSNLYLELVPHEVQQTILNRINEENAALEVEREASRQYTVFRAVEDGVVLFFQMDGVDSLLDVGKFLRRCFREGQEPTVSTLQTAFARLEPITAEQYNRLAALRADDPRKVPGMFDLNFDRQEVSSVDAAGGWRSYSMKDISIASYYAFRKNCSDSRQYEFRFQERLAGREATAVKTKCGKKRGGEAR